MPIIGIPYRSIDIASTLLLNSQCKEGASDVKDHLGTLIILKSIEYGQNLYKAMA